MDSKIMGSRGRSSGWRVASGEWRVASGEWRVASGEVEGLFFPDLPRFVARVAP